MEDEIVPEVALALAALPPFPSEVGDDISARRDAVRRMREASGRTLADTVGFTRRDLLITGLAAEPQVRVRMYRPAADSSLGSHSLPAVLYFHGGGFSLGDLDAEDGSCVRICTQVGCVVVSVDYRLAPEHPYPASVRDGYGALRWLSAEAAAAGVDRSRIAVAGGSAGGGLAAAVALMSRDEGGPPLCFQLLVYPEIDDRMENHSSGFRGVPIFDGAAKARSWAHYLGPNPGPTEIYAAPNRCDDLAGLPPAYILTAGLDPLRDEGLEYAMKLLRDGVPVEIHHFPGVPHGWDIFAPRALSSKRSWDDRLAVLRTAFARDNRVRLDDH